MNIKGTVTGCVAICFAIILIELWFGVKSQVAYYRVYNQKRAQFFAEIGVKSDSTEKERKDLLLKRVAKDPLAQEYVTKLQGGLQEGLQLASDEWHNKTLYPLWSLFSYSCTFSPPERIFSLSQFLPGFVELALLVGVTGFFFIRTRGRSSGFQERQTG